MGSYDREYEKYYRKINKVRKTSPKHDIDFKAKKSYKRRGENNLGKCVIREFVNSSVLVFFISSGFFLSSQVENDFLKNLTLKFKEVIATDGYYRNLDLNESKIIAKVSSKFHEGFNLENYSLKKKPKDESFKEDLSKEDEEVSVFNDFQVVEKESIDFLKESKVIPFDGKVKTLKSNDLKGKSLYLSGLKDEVRSLLKGTLSEIENKEGKYTAKVKYYEDLEVLYHNLGEVTKKEGEKIEEGEKIGVSSEGGEVSGVVLQVLFKNEYIDPKESMSFLGDKQ